MLVAVCMAIPKGRARGMKAFQQAISWTLKRGNLVGFPSVSFLSFSEALRNLGKGLDMKIN